jgi:hypothetical protein
MPRQMYATRIAAGPQDPGAWDMLFRGHRKPQFPRKFPAGRGYMSYGASVFPIQLAYATLQQSRAMALGRPAELAPYDDWPAVFEDARAESEAMSQASSAPPGPAQTGVLGHELGQRLAPPAAPDPILAVERYDKAAACRLFGMSLAAFEKYRQRYKEGDLARGVLPFPRPVTVRGRATWTYDELTAWYHSVPGLASKPLSEERTPGHVRDS